LHYKNYFFSLLESIIKKLPIKDPEIKLIPAIKLIGSLTVSPNNKLTLVLFELFCIPTIKKINNEELNAIAKTNFFKFKNIFDIFIGF
tara:strand:+ start:302 stop:565 length:264 start_codon:yes stop_codon:yes gene_type:complete